MQPLPQVMLDANHCNNDYIYLLTGKQVNVSDFSMVGLNGQKCKYSRRTSAAVLPFRSKSHSSRLYGTIIRQLLPVTLAAHAFALGTL